MKVFSKRFAQEKNYSYQNRVQQRFSKDTKFIAVPQPILMLLGTILSEDKGLVVIDTHLGILIFNDYSRFYYLQRIIVFSNWIGILVSFLDLDLLGFPILFGFVHIKKHLDIIYLECIIIDYNIE